MLAHVVVDTDYGVRTDTFIGFRQRCERGANLATGLPAEWLVRLQGAGHFARSDRSRRFNSSDGQVRTTTYLILLECPKSLAAPEISVVAFIRRYRWHQIPHDKTLEASL
jgi:hypothetical protein